MFMISVEVAMTEQMKISLLKHAPAVGVATVTFMLLWAIVSGAV
jgi:hypothetical protein